MLFQVSAALLDCLVLATVQRDATYGYKITQEIRGAIPISESTLYPVLRRLLKNGDLDTYDAEYMGRNRRYYTVTDKGKKQLAVYVCEWEKHKCEIDNILKGCQV